MRRNQPLTMEQITSRLHVDCDTGRCFWKVPPKGHARLAGAEAGSSRKHRQTGEAYWVIKIDGIPYKRSHIVLMAATGQWPTQMVDHKNGTKLDDRADNLRHATALQNNQNHQRRAKRSATPMGVRKLPSGRYQARITLEKRQVVIGCYETQQAAEAAYRAKRKEYFRDFA